MSRQKEVIKVSIIGIVVNLFLVGFKAFVGLVSGSISIISDALNNLSDAVSSIVTIVGMIFASRKPDKKHPYGYGKLEHVSALVIGVIIFGTGFSLIMESLNKIRQPEVADFNILMLFIIAVGVVAKLFLGLFVKKKGEKLKSGSLIASGKDALFDVLISTSTLVGALITYFFGVTIDGWIGLVISILIIKTSVGIVSENMSLIIGERIDSEFSNKIKKAVMENKEVLGAYDLVLHQYGPEKIIGSIHIEVSDDLTAREIHILTREITERIYKKFGAVLTIGIYATNTGETDYARIKTYIKQLVGKYKNVSQLHGYYIDRKKKIISFDLVFSFEEKNVEKIVSEITEKINKKYPEYNVNIIPDADY